MSSGLGAVSPGSPALPPSMSPLTGHSIKDIAATIHRIIVSLSEKAPTPPINKASSRDISPVRPSESTPPFTEHALATVSLSKTTMATPPSEDSPPLVERAITSIKICGKLMHLPRDAYHFTAPVVKMPKSWENLSPKEKEAKVTECLEKYGKARAALEHSVAAAASIHPASMLIANKIAARMFDLINAEAYLRFVEKEKRPPRPVELTLAVNRMLVDLFGAEKSTDSGSIGVNPLAIRNIFKEGNLREKMYIPYKTTFAFTGKIFWDPNHVKRLNDCLLLMGKTWSIDSDFIRNITSYDIYDHSPITGLSREEDIRVRRSSTEREAVADAVALPVLSPLRIIPLSQREVLASTGELTDTLIQEKSKKKVKWQTGVAWLRPKTRTEISSSATTYTYLCGIEALRAPQMASISGSADNMMTLARCLGISSEEELTQFRLAIIACMVGDKSHTVIEVMMASKGFELEFHPRPDDYPDIYPGDDRFMGTLRAEQLRQGFQMPDTYLSPEE